MEELLKALAPWPLAQGIVIGLAIAGVGFWAMKRGMQDRKRREEGGDAQHVRVELSDDEKRLQWAAYKQLENIEKNSFTMVKLLGTIAEGVNRIADTRFNAGQ